MSKELMEKFNFDCEVRSNKEKKKLSLLKVAVILFLEKLQTLISFRK